MKDFFELTLDTAAGLLDEPPISAITALIKDTQTGKLNWRKHKLPNSAFYLAYMSEAYDTYIAEHGPLTFAVSERLQDRDPALGFSSHFILEDRLRRGVLLSVLNKKTNTSITIPNNSVLVDLLSSVKNQVAEVEEYGWGMVATKRSSTSRRRLAHLREMILEAYDYKCAISGEEIRELLEIANLSRFSTEGSDSVANYIVLRNDLHRLFDSGLISVTPNYAVVVSDKIRVSSYTAYQGKRIYLPENPHFHPSQKALIKHNEQVFSQA